jgi:hypothetical protein
MPKNLGRLYRKVSQKRNGATLIKLYHKVAQRTTELHRVWFVSHGQLVTGMPKMQFRLFVVVPQSCTEKLRVTQS